MKTIYLNGNTHFDPVWLWNWDEAMASIRSTFRSALERMKEDPAFRYSFSAPAVLRWIEDVDPALFGEIRERVKEGRWELGEGWWLQADAYTATGESYVRQGLYGQRWLKEKFGKTSTTCYSIDSFGHPDSLPGLLTGCGIRQIVFCRPEEHMKKFPAPLFRWVGQDGEEVLAYQVGGEECPAYAPDLRKGLNALLRHLPEHDCDRLVVYGVTDHGGAPTKECLAVIHDMEQNEPRARFRIADVEEFFADQRGKPMPTVTGELDVTYIGPSVNVTEIKKNNRRAEWAALRAEAASVAAAALCGAPVCKDVLRGVWQDVMFNQFHDILGGCCIPSAFTDARDLHGRAIRTANELTHARVQAVTKNIAMPGKNGECAWNLCVWNLSGAAGEQWIDASAQWAWEFPWYRGGIELVAPDGTVIPAQPLRSDAVIPGFRSRFLFRADLPAYGWRTFAVRQTGAPAPIVARDGDAGTISDGNVTLVLGEHGGIREVRASDGSVLSRDLLVPFVQKDICDTWGFNKTVYEDEKQPLSRVSARIVEDGELRTTVKTVLRYGTSTVEQYLSLYHPTGEIECRVRALWSEERCALRLSASLPGKSTLLASEPCGAIRREESPYERPFAGWLALAGEGAHMAILTDGVFACRYQDGALALSVLRNAVMGDLRTEPLDESGDYAYMGQGETVVSLRVSFRDGAPDEGLLAAAEARFTAPPVAVLEANHGGSLPADMAFAEITGEGITPMALKPAEDGDGVVFRFRNAGDTPASGTLRLFGREYPLSAPPRAVRTLLISGGGARNVDLLEE